MDEPQIDDRLRGLYREPPDGFIASRDALAKELRTAGRTDEAAQVKALKKPTVPAWAIDQLSDRDPGSIQELLDAGAEVRAAQQATMSSAKGAERLRESTAAWRQVLAGLARQASAVLTESGRPSDTHMDDIRATLESASVDPELGERLRAGTLDRPVRSPRSIGDVFGLHAVPDEDEDRADEDEGQPGTGVAERQSENRKTSRAERARLRRDAEAASRRAGNARERADRLAGQIEAMKARLQELVEKHAVTESQALEAEMDARRASEAADSERG